MNNKFKMLLLCFLLICGSGFCGSLHVFYEQNGDCYVLVGSGTYRGVYALNNLTTDNYTYMYDPDESYGISAGQWWSGSSNETSPSFIQKRLYTFTGTDAKGISLDGKEVKRRVLARGDTGVYGYDPPYIVHGAHSRPTDSPTGLGNHTTSDYCQSLIRFFTPSDIPCTEVPRSAGKDSAGYDLYWVTAGTDWYHARDYNVWSDFTYYGWSGIPGRNGGGGWCHRVVKEHIQEDTRTFDLLAMNVNNKNAPTRDTTLCQSNLATVSLGTSGTAETLGECVDGCIRAQPDVALPGTPGPILSLAYSSQVKRSYLYNRPDGETAYTLLGKGGGDIIVGKGDNLTCKFVGLSTKGSDSNFVYLLGKDVINEWLSAAGMSSQIADNDDLACVAVSDQWWQTGGIVYAYDSKKGLVYQFTRVEGGKSGYPNVIDVQFDGIKPDKIGADGFGNLYVLKTEKEPANPTFKDGTEYKKKWAFKYNNIDHYIAYFKQNIYKTVYKRPYGEKTSFSKINKRISLGYNEWEREYITADNNINSKKNWTTNLQQSRYADDKIRTELAVINVPTPPRPENVDAIADCCGPMEATLTSGFVKASPDNPDGSYSSTRNICFIAENFPSFDANGLNEAGATDDMDGDGTVGCFPNTIQESSIVYHWKIVKTKDQFGNPISSDDKDYLVLDTVGDYVLVFPSLLEGEFDVGVKVEYRYYDYTKLKVGALASDKHTCLYPKLGSSPLVAKAGGRIVRDGYSWEHIKQTWKKPPESLDGKGIIMTSLNYDDESGYQPAISGNDKNLKMTEFVMDGASLCKKVDNNKNISYKSNNRWGMKLRETKANLDKGLDRTSIVKQSQPPNPNDPRMVEGSLKWVDDLKVVWRADLKRGTQSIWTKTIPVENFNLTQSQLRELMPMPSDPLKYEINASVYRPYTYMVYVKIPIRREGSEWIYKEERVPVIVTVSIDAEAEVCVTDNVGPSLYQYNAEEGAETRIVPGYKMIYANSAGKEDKGTVFLKASTGETLDKWNPGKYLVFYVCDNNPMANYSGAVGVNNGTKDKYHLKSDPNALKTSFVQNDKTSRQATFHYDTAKGIMPTDDKKSEYTYNLNTTIKPEVVTDETELKSVGLVPSKALSYLKYKIPVTVMKDFSDGTGAMEGLENAKLPFNYANNTGGYTNYRFGLSWQERCNASYNVLNNETEVVGSDKEKYFVGNIVIKDNDRPNIFITGFQDRFPNLASQFRVPTIVTEEKYNKLFDADENGNVSSTKNTDQWFLTVNDESNGQEKWYTSFGGNIANLFDFLKPKPTNVSTTLFRNKKSEDSSGGDVDCRLLTDVPATFKYVMIDNAGKPNCLSFELYDESNNTRLAQATDETIQYVFRNKGKYYLELKVEDDAKDWPDNSNAIDNPTNADDKHQTRVLRAYFEVLDTKFDYRVLERGINER